MEAEWLKMAEEENEEATSLQLRKARTDLNHDSNGHLHDTENEESTHEKSDSETDEESNDEKPNSETDEEEEVSDVNEHSDVTDNEASTPKNLKKPVSWVKDEEDVDSSTCSSSENEETVMNGEDGKLEKSSENEETVMNGENGKLEKSSENEETVMNGENGKLEKSSENEETVMNGESGKLEKSSENVISVNDSEIQPNLEHSEVNGKRGIQNEIEQVDTEQIYVQDEAEEIDLDVEKVLKTQTTHDLFCPNCNSCITRRVILRKRKRRIKILEEEVKRTKTEITCISEQSNDELHIHQPTVEDDNDRDTGPDVFRCLSCFSFFIPSGSGFRLFSRLGDKSRKGDIVDGEQVSTRKKKWFSSIFESKSQEIAVEQAPRDSEDLLRPGNELVLNGRVIQSSKGDKMDQLKEPKSSTEVKVSGSEWNLHVTTVRDTTLIINNKDSSDSATFASTAVGQNSVINQQSKGISSDEEIIQISSAGMPEYKNINIYEHGKMDQYEQHKSSTEEHFSGGEWNLHVTTVRDTTLITNNEDISDSATLSSTDSVPNSVIYTYRKPIFEQSNSHTTQMGSSDEEIIQMIPSAGLPEHKISVSDTKFNISDSRFHEEHNDITKDLDTSLIEKVKGTYSYVNDGQVHPTEISQSVIISGTKLEVPKGESLKVGSILSDKGIETVITVETCPVPDLDGVIVVPEGRANSVHMSTQVGIAAQERIEASRSNSRIEVIKSIVYGGLAETITSLSVVSSASGGDAATLNIVALGMANLIGGLFVISHNLWDLKCDVTNQASDIALPRKDRYKELLGRRENFIFHAIICILSYLTFGLIPVAVYGFSFHKSDDKELKLVVVGVVSLLCIVVLSIGKAYVCHPPKAYLKTIMNFVMLGFMASGISYAVGVLFERLLEKLGLFHSTPVERIFLHEIASKGSGLTSY